MKAIKLKLTFKKELTLIFIVMSFFMFGQNKEEPQIRTVFSQLVMAYGNSKSAPELVLKKMSIPAKYSSEGKPKIEVDLKLYTICKTYGKDSLNALSIVLSHELAHYYYDHTFCSDYAYAYLKPENKNLAKSVRESRLNSRIEKESEADYKGFFYAAAAGFQPFGLQYDLIETIYKSYKLSDLQPGYPSKQKRKELVKGAEAKAKELFGYFQSGLKSIEEKRYDDAILAFDKANSFIPYRENLNNMGVARTLKALPLKEITSEEIHHPERFLYPLEIENTSRLNKKDATRSLDDGNDDMEKLLKEAQKNFEEAIRLDPNFTKGYINLACVQDLLGDPEGAISKVTKQLLPKGERESVDAQRILAIAYSHSKVKEYQDKAEEIWKHLGK
jgi:tetratricopeptide (TPR) repeat protein